ncbi:MAG TPA: class I SAM-dependent rRNA methyltransferase, partial [Deltaproteobacteria bacterium]|nr:class I SAM-dependent rRNA methyltransferase [Deltaproteobacteria bacterium]
MLIVRLKPKKEMPALQGHPWIYSGAVDNVQGEPEKDRLCRVLNAKGQFVCQGMYNPISQLAVRVLTLGKEPVDRAFFLDRIRSAAALRRSIVAPDTTCYRLINAEGDRLPGLVVDRYSDVLVVQLITPFMDDFKAELVDMLRAEFPACCIFERSDTRTRSNEGFRPCSGPLWGEFESRETTVQEHGLAYAVDVLTGDRTGFYLEHSLTRQRIRAHAQGKQVLDLFSYTGSFSVSALAGGAASVVSVDSSAPAQVLLKRNMELHRIRPFVWRHVKDEAQRFLSDDRTLYDMVLCDAPAFGNEFEEHCRMVNLAMARVSP